ncbi:helix-turn-helix domain-containing protein [Streptomyces sp. NPDC055078]
MPDRSARDLFGSEMRRLRMAAGMSLERLAEVIRYSKSSLARFEIAEAMIPPDLSAKLDAAFGTDQLFEKLYGLARKEIHPDRYRRHMELEARARVIREFAGHVVPGLVQTEDYARALFRAHNPKAKPEEIQDLMTARLSRQALLQGEDPPHFFGILDETVIRRPVGGPAVMRAQLAALLPLVDSPTTTLQILPFDHGEHALLGGGLLRVLTLDNGTVVAYQEGVNSGTLFEAQDLAGPRQHAYELMTAYALPPRETAALIRATMEALPT